MSLVCPKMGLQTLEGNDDGDRGRRWVDGRSKVACHHMAKKLSPVRGRTILVRVQVVVYEYSYEDGQGVSTSYSYQVPSPLAFARPCFLVLCRHLASARLRVESGMNFATVP